ncbi:unnamed protein product [Chondrus crispus]|uniref:tRNA pseudouridine synthase n=1 Tax=Chondrus crispus TaxID=2769 RepID=R7QN10_CHOCR|nr:unnamed protein product [Chondrus crispus]CDF38770.1 unnamed protein product [Chondrus crispus]|eukprot:XP_005718675.1 unnamed protein product [Chondrus crispus]
MSAFVTPPLPSPSRGGRARPSAKRRQLIICGAVAPPEAAKPGRASSFPSNPDKQRIRARVAYDGTLYRGWQYQTDQPTVQGALEDALRRKFGHTIRVVGASRTDTGVHARGQAMHFDIPIARALRDGESERKFHYTLNQMLPPDVRVPVLSVAPTVVPCKVTDECGNVGIATRPWHAIYNAKGKLYTYRISTSPVFDPLGRLYRYHEWRATKFGFSEELLREASAKFVGSHDFSAFTNSTNPPPGFVPPVLSNPIRHIHSATVIPEGAGMYRIEFVINGAMYRMIRNIMGTILSVSCGSMDISNIDHLFASKDRRLVPKSAPAKGLCLEKVIYDEWEPLGAQ